MIWDFELQIAIWITAVLYRIRFFIEKAKDMVILIQVEFKKLNLALMVICYLSLEHDDPIRLLAGKPESWDAKRTQDF